MTGHKNEIDAFMDIYKWHIKQMYWPGDSHALDEVTIFYVKLTEKSYSLIQ